MHKRALFDCLFDYICARGSFSFWVSVLHVVYYLVLVRLGLFNIGFDMSDAVWYDKNNWHE